MLKRCLCTYIVKIFSTDIIVHRSSIYCQDCREKRGLRISIQYFSIFFKNKQTISLWWFYLMWLYFENVCVCVCRNICDIRHIGFTSVMPLQDLWFLFSIVDSCCQKKNFYTDGAYQKYQTGEKINSKWEKSFLDYGIYVQ